MAKTKTVELEITENLLYNLELPPREAERQLRIELALTLCEQERLPRDLAGRFSGLAAPDFDALLAERSRVRETEEYIHWDVPHFPWENKHRSGASLSPQDGGKDKGRASLKIPEEVLEALQLAPEEAERELRKELALDLYEQWIVGGGVVRRFADLTLWEFFDLRGERKIAVQYSLKDLEHDIRSALGG